MSDKVISFEISEDIGMAFNGYLASVILKRPLLSADLQVDAPTAPSSP
jgi:hypothetical protein